MIDDKRLKFVKSENGINYYLFKPTLFSLYYDDKENLWFRGAATHSLGRPTDEEVMYALKMAPTAAAFISVTMMWWITRW